MTIEACGEQTGGNLLVCDFVGEVSYWKNIRLDEC